MSIEVHSLARLRVYLEPNGSFAVDNTASGSFSSEYTAVPAMEGTMTLTVSQDTLDPLPLQQFKDGRYEKVLGRRSAKLSFSLPLAPTGTAAGSTTTAVQGALGKLLSVVMGGEALTAGSTVNDAGATTTAIILTSTDAGGGSSATMVGGNAIGFLPGSSTTPDWRVIDSVSSNTVNLKLALSTAPANSSICYGAATYYLTEDPNTSLQFLCEGVETDDRWLVLGCQLESMAMEVQQGSIPTITFNFQCAQWLDRASVASTGNVTSSFTSNLSYSNYNPIPAVSGAYYAWVNGTTTYSATNSRLNVTNESFSPNLNYVPVPSPSGTQGIFRFVRGRANTHSLTGSFSVPYESLGTSSTVGFDWKNNLRDMGFVRQIGSAAGSTVLIDAPTAQVVDVAPMTDENGLQYQRLTWEARHDGDTALDSSLGRSAFRIHLC